MMVLTREQKERLVLDLYNKGRTYREIAKEARISPRDIGIILRKVEQQNNQRPQQEEDSGRNDGKAAAEPLDKTTEAYKLFSQGKKPIEVAVALGINAEETIRLFQEFWKLKHLYTLNSVYEQIGEELKTFLKLYNIAKNQGMLENLEGFVNVLISAAYDIPLLQRKVELLKNEVDNIQHQKQEANIELQKLSDQIVELKKLERSHSEACSRLQQDIGYHVKQKQQLIGSIETFKRSDKKYNKIKAMAIQHINSFLADQKIMMSGAIVAVIEALRMHPNKHTLICCNDGSYNGDDNDISDESIAVLSEIRSDYSHDENEIGDIAIVTDTANTLYNRIREWLVEKTIASVIQMEQGVRRD